jgi:phosphoribosylanthranilate isomerase
MWVKICGTTNLEDALLAAELHADAVGFVFAESKRRVTPQEVATITPQLPKGIERVGVFHSFEEDEIVSAIEAAGLTAAQLHGGVDNTLAENLRKRLGSGVTLIQTVHWTADADESETRRRVMESLASIASNGVIDRVLVDSKVGAALGGTGTAFDWNAAQEIFRRPNGLKMIVAGGLNQDNVAEAIARLEPWGVDVVTGVEAEPGRKSPGRITSFMKNAKGPREAKAGQSNNR